MRAVLALLLVAAAAGLGWIAAEALTINGDAPRSSGGAAPAEADAPLNLTLAAPVETDYAEIAARPLFSAVRRPPPPEAPGTPLDAPDDGLLFGRYEIAGVVMLGDAAMAMLRDESGRLIRVRAGDTVATRSGGADVIEITMSALTFEEGGERVVAQVGGSDESGGAAAQ